MSYRAIYAYAWDIAEAGVAESIAEFRSLGLDTVTMAGSYHAGKFLRPHGRTGKVYFPEDGTAYFRTTPHRYGAIKPVENRMLADRDVLRELCAGPLQVNAWMVLLHNTLLGTIYPEATVANAFGDRYVYSLCPSSPEARAYAVGLAHDVTESYPVIGVSMEFIRPPPSSFGEMAALLTRACNWPPLSSNRWRISETAMPTSS